MKTVYVANKSSYGAGFFGEFDTLLDLKMGIVSHELDDINSDYNDDMYAEKLFEKHSAKYELCEVSLHDDERIMFNEYDGQSSFYIEKKIRPLILSSIRKIC
jgi:hypothetical protein